MSVFKNKICWLLVTLLLMTVVYFVYTYLSSTKIQLGLDIGTLLSVIGTACFFFYNDKKSKKKEAKEHQSKLRIEYMQKGIALISGEIENLLRLEEEIQWEIVYYKIENREVRFDVRKIYNAAHEIVIKCNILLATTFATWADEKEKERVEHLCCYTKAWLENFFVKNLDKTGEPKSIASLVEKVSDTIKELSDLLAENKGLNENNKESTQSMKNI